MTYHLKSLLNRLRQTEERFIKLESVVLNLSQVEQVQHQILHQLRARD